MRSMPRHPLTPALLLAVALAGCATTTDTTPADAAAPAASAPEESVATAAGLVGTLDGAAYRIDRPADWNGSLIVFLHGYETPGPPRPTELAQDAFDQWALSKGYAVARSAYSTTGWATAEAVPESEHVRSLAIESLGAPKHTYLVGQSLGGHLVLAMLEANPEAYDGVLSFCGVNAPAAEVFADAILAPLVATELWLPAALGLAPGGLADPASPSMLDPETIEKALASNPAATQRIAERFGIPKAQLGQGLWLRYLALREMIPRAGGFPADNRHTKYTGMGDDAAFNAAVRRYAGDPKAMAYVAANAPLTGAAPKPVVVLANVTDPLVPATISNRYAELAKASGDAANVFTLPPTGDGHCAFDSVTIDRAFTVLTGWVESGTRPQ